ncbi:tRNA (adenine(22)-N(1))-methyltransferase TrmK [Vibrio gallaecicus]|uniref:tRNA (adenine(22)-N(1))-methyltransferase n=1 Tax=Vibrio gallaecicus TaxID=552386 RepID=UPI0010C9E123|nr:tRNA (adenine(22)-N(1))-methyltransferase TrmK [Vibrio gallaecicus]MDN3616326.1 tRNA (adenine(22)-N(1))-methyltransferase TrmK [Vibrio gallaecicus]
MKLSKRLQTIESLVGDEYTHIWDCCCDHGFLGTHLLTANKAPTIHFIDIVPQLMDELEIKLARYFPKSEATESTWEVHCGDVVDIAFDQYEGKHLVIIAGVGGDLTQHFIESIHAQYLTLALDFLICPVHQQFELRQQLQQLNFQMKDECLLEENRRFYEIMLLSNQPQQQPSQKVHPVGEKIWQADTELQLKTALNYRSKTLQHYQRLQLGKQNQVEHIIEAYKAIQLPELSS